MGVYTSLDSIVEDELRAIAYEIYMQMLQGERIREEEIRNSILKLVSKIYSGNDKYEILKDIKGYLYSGPFGTFEIDEIAVIKLVRIKRREYSEMRGIVMFEHKKNKIKRYRKIDKKSKYPILANNLETQVIRNFLLGRSIAYYEKLNPDFYVSFGTLNGIFSEGYRVSMIAIFDPFVGEYDYFKYLFLVTWDNNHYNKILKLRAFDIPALKSIISDKGYLSSIIDHGLTVRDLVYAIRGLIKEIKDGNFIERQKPKNREIKLKVKRL